MDLEQAEPFELRSGGSFSSVVFVPVSQVLKTLLAFSVACQ